MNHLSLFSGIGGLDLAAEWARFTTVAFVERDKYCQRVLARHWPGVPIWDDANAFGLRQLQPERCKCEERRRTCDGGRVELISGGFPCQPHSAAGKRQASADERDLWGECARIVGEFRPRWAVFENVPGILSSEGGRFFARILDDLAALGYVVTWFTYGACDVGAPHRRDRVFIVAHAGRAERRAQSAGGCDTDRSNEQGQAASRIAQRGEDVADANGAGFSQQCGSEPVRPEQSPAQRGGWWFSEPDVGRVAHGVPSRVDRLRALGNAVVPQQAYPIFKAIADIEGLDNVTKKVFNESTE